MEFHYAPGATPLDPDEVAGLVPTHITTQADLNAWEQINIVQGDRWAARQKKRDLLDEGFIRDLHYQMFDKTWQWAGTFRKSNKNIGVDWMHVAVKLRNLLDNTKYQIENHAPFSRQYESYSLEGLRGDSFSVQDRFAKWDEVFREMKPVCTQCENSLTEANTSEIGDGIRITRVKLPSHKGGMFDQARAFLSYARAVQEYAADKDYDLVVATSSRLMTATVYHAAAYKHVPLVEHNPAEGVKNNVFGTLSAAKAAAENGVSDFVLISTDKAVRPTNIMGASKRLAEMLLQALAATNPGTKFSMVRFGNVLGSSGSVVPKFRQQIRDGGPITLTHPDITRYFMTIPEASQLVIQAGAMAKGGDVFVLDMGQSVKILDLARRMVELSGLTVRDQDNNEGDIEIEITGLRPGEKLYEELLIGDDPKQTSHPRIMKAHEEFIRWEDLEGKLDALAIALSVNDVGVIRLMMEKLVSGYRPSEEIVDWVYLEQEAEAQVIGATDG